jgi:hypothetical protein
MKFPSVVRRTRLVGLLLSSSLLGLGVGTLYGQEANSTPRDTSQDTPREKPAAPAANTMDQQKPPASDAIISSEHPFWDTTNDLLFAGVAGARTLDYFSTLNMRHRGRQEILLTNDVVDNHPAFAVIEAAGTAASIGVSYLFHRYGHHKLERWTSAVHIGLATTGSVRNYCLKTAHPAGATPP